MKYLLTTFLLYYRKLLNRMLLRSRIQNKISLSNILFINTHLFWKDNISYLPKIGTAKYD